MNKLEFPTGYNILELCTEENTMTIKFYDTSSDIDIDITNPSYYKTYYPYNQWEEYEPHIDNYSYSLFSGVSLVKSSSLPILHTTAENWNVVNKEGFEITPNNSLTLYLLDAEGNIITSAYMRDLSEESRSGVTFSGFKVYTIIDLSTNKSKITITYEGAPLKENSFTGYFVAVNQSYWGINYNIYYCIKLNLVNQAREYYYGEYPYNREFIRYSTDTPTFAKDMQWLDVSEYDEETVTTVTILVDNLGNIKLGSPSYVNICKFLNLETPITVSSNIEYLKETEDGWITITPLNILDIRSFNFTFATNSGIARLNIVYLRNLDVYSYPEDILVKIIISQDSASGIEDLEYEYYTAKYRHDETETTLEENTLMLLYINKAGTGIDTYVPEAYTDAYTINIIKKKHIPNVLPDIIESFTPLITGTTDWVTCTAEVQSDISMLISIEPQSGILMGESRSTTIIIKDGELTLLSIAVSQSAEGEVAVYYLYGKKKLEDDWLLYCTSLETIGFETIKKNWYGGDVDDDPNPLVIVRKPELRYYKLVCNDDSVTLDINSISINLQDEDLPTVTATILEITDSSSTESNKIVFSITYEVVSSLSSIYSESKYIYVNYEELSHSINITLEGQPYDSHNYNYDLAEESAIWNGKPYVKCTDTGEGDVVDATSLLYKGSTGNIYKTIEAKDTRLFLGNYKTPKELNDIREKGINIFKDLTVNEGFHYNQLNGNISDIITKLNSDDIRILKKGESYLLGVVFMYKTGQFSDVYMLENPNTANGEYSLTHLMDTTYVIHKKSFFYVPLTRVILDLLYKAGIAAIIPVRAINTSFNIIALGFSLPTILIDSRSLDGKNILLYPYSFRASASDSLITTGFSKNTNIVVINTPEMDCSEDMTLSSFNCTLKATDLDNQGYITSLKNVELQVDSKYLLSHHTGTSTWFGFVDNGDRNTLSPSEYGNYAYFPIYVWNKEIVAGEWPAAKIKKKIFVYGGETELINPNFSTSINNVTCHTYRNYDYVELKNIANYLYQGNIDYSLSSLYGYTVPYTNGGSGTEGSGIVKASGGDFTYTLESGINSEGRCYAPVWMRYKATPHLVAKLPADKNLPNYSIVELYNIESIARDKVTRPYLQWIKCGPMVSTSIPTPRPLRFLAGDYFYGKYECLRTYPYSTSDPNSVVEIYSGYLASKVNLVCRADVNVGNISSYLNPTNFNIFNPVYNLEDNFFTYTYRGDNISYDRNFSNTILWSLNKSYGSMIDEWCHIQNVNSLDLDGDKGELTSIEKFNDSLIAFLTTGISLILFNDNVQVSSSTGVPIEIMNSGKVEGKRYLLDRIGCQNRESIVNSPKYLYFIDSINKGIYTLDNSGSVTDITYSKGMKSWALDSITKEWWGYYDIYSLEVLFASSNSCVAYNDMLEYFPCFLSYENIKNTISLNGRTYLFNKVDSKNTLWKKNAIHSNKIFDTKVPIVIEMIINPEPTEDKTFETVEYRADGFYTYNNSKLFFKDNKYNETASFDTIRVSNEYLDTTDIPLVKSAGGNTYLPSANALKKFRTWRVLIPRAKYYNYDYSEEDTSSKEYNSSKDRIRNPWCKVKFVTTMNDYEKLIVHDFAVKYSK